MMGNYQVRFLGDKGGVIRLRYPTYNTRSMKTFSIIPGRSRRLSKNSHSKALRNYFVILMLCLTGEAGAQNWEPLDRTEKFDFSKSSVTYITNTVCVDSAFLVGADSVFYLNRIVTNCDTCPAGYKLCNQPGILKQRMLKKPNGIYNFRTPGSVVIKTLASVGNVWLYDTAQSINAQVVSKTLTQVFGANDSVKNISLSNGKTVILSKNHGLLQFADSAAGSVYILQGIEGRNVGMLMPRFADMFNFQPGDVFQYFHTYGHGNWPFNYLIKNTILTRDSASGIYTYVAIQGVKEWDNIGSYITCEQVTLTYHDSDYPQADLYPGTVIENPTPQGYGTTFICVCADSLGVFSKYLGGFDNYYVNQLYIHADYAYPGMSHDVLIPDSNQGFSRTFKTGLGYTHYGYTGPPDWDFDLANLIGYIKNNDTVGLVYPDSYYPPVSVEENSHADDLSIFPNPAQDKLCFKGINDPGLYAFSLYDATGTVILEGELTACIDLSGIRPGIYIIRVISGNSREVITRKIFRQ